MSWLDLKNILLGKRGSSSHIVHTVGFQFYEAHEKATLIYGG